MQDTDSILGFAGRSRSMRRRDLIGGFAVTLVAAACAPAAPSPAPAAKPATAATAKPAGAKPAAAKPAKITIAYPGSMAFNHVASYIAWEALKAKGYTIETKQYSNINLATNGVVGGEAQIGWIAAAAAMNALRAGAKMKAFFHGQRNVFLVIAKKSINSFKDMDRKPFADTISGNINDGMRKGLEKKFGAQPQVVRLNESGQRAQAIIAGQVEAAGAMQPEDFLEVDSKKPGEYKILVRYSEEYPTVGGTFIWVRDDFVEQYPDTMADAAEALILTYRRAYDAPAEFLVDVKKFMPTVSDDLLKASLRAYTEPKYWDPNGGVSEAVAKGTADFYAESEIVKDPPPPDQWMNWKIVDAALAKLGKR